MKRFVLEVHTFSGRKDISAVYEYHSKKYSLVHINRLFVLIKHSVDYRVVTVTGAPSQINDVACYVLGVIIHPVERI